MPGWLIILIIFVVGGAIWGILASLLGDDHDVNPAQGCLFGALGGGVGGIGCLGTILSIILPILIAVLIFNWLFSGCS